MIISLILAMMLLLFISGSSNALDELESTSKFIELHVLVDNDGRISYTGSEDQCKANLTKELKLVKLTGSI